MVEIIHGIIPLPLGLGPVNIRFHKHGPEDYAMTLNIHCLLCVMTGAVCIRCHGKGSTKPNAWSLKFKVTRTPVSCEPRKVQHEVANGKVETYIKTIKGLLFNVTFPLPGSCQGFDII